MAEKQAKPKHPHFVGRFVYEKQQVPPHTVIYVFLSGTGLIKYDEQTIVVKSSAEALGPVLMQDTFALDTESPVYPAIEEFVNSGKESDDIFVLGREVEVPMDLHKRLEAHYKARWQLERKLEELEIKRNHEDDYADEIDGNRKASKR